MGIAASTQQAMSWSQEPWGHTAHRQGVVCRQHPKASRVEVKGSAWTHPSLLQHLSPHLAVPTTTTAAY